MSERPRGTRRIPLRWRLAGVSSALTCLVLLAFAVGIGTYLDDSLRNDFSDTTAEAAETLAGSLTVAERDGAFVVRGVDVNDFAGSQHARIRLVDLAGGVIAQSVGAPDFGIRPIGESRRDGYLIETRAVSVGPLGQVLVQYGRPIDDLERTVHAIWLALAVGVLGGSLLALAAGLAVSRRTLRPLADLTEAAGRVSRTADPGVEIAIPPANDEVRDLAVTLNSAFERLEAAQATTEAALDRQRQFVADASHELRTPLTSLLANLELLARDAEGDAREDAAGALRSARRMSDLVAELLLLARSDAGTHQRVPLQLDRLCAAAADEMRPLLADRSLETVLERVAVIGDEATLHQAVRNLIANAIGHTPDGTRIRLSSAASPDGHATVTVDDSGPGLDDGATERIFERFTTGAGDGGRGTGLGLAISKAVVEMHGGTITAGASPLGGARFVIALPAAQASTTTGTTIGRRRS